MDKTLPRILTDLSFSVDVAGQFVAVLFDADFPPILSVGRGKLEDQRLNVSFPSVSPGKGFGLHQLAVNDVE